MRLWHQDLIEKLPRQQLLGQHRECCALRGNGWGKPHATVNYVFHYPPSYLVDYHQLVMDEMKSRGYKVSEEWLNPLYRGKKCDAFLTLSETVSRHPIYPEHNLDYLNGCKENLANKGVYI
ncbi:TIGR02328 family protein [Enterococcus italicus]|uniref:TIGR02328 family protein n=1 Tax=Enterococcus italicus TaxID=246144 RepID=UPI003F487517